MLCGLNSDASILIEVDMPYSNMIDELRSAIPILLAEYEVPGLSVSVIDHHNTIMQEGFGFTDAYRRYKVTPKTLFSIQSISKTYVAFGFLAAVEKELVSLDEPIKKYLPRFQVRSRDNIDYAGSITFRHLLSHRSGLPHEAPIGNNYCYGNFEQHIESISGLWLKHPPGEHYSYSNLGFDLIG
jgi:CubicO group peptidase (beta-lactamase class C family)